MKMAELLSLSVYTFTLRLCHTREQILLKVFYFGRALFSEKANRKSQKLFPFVKMIGTRWVYPYNNKWYCQGQMYRNISSFFQYIKQALLFPRLGSSN